MAWKLAYITAVLPLALGWQLPILHCLCILLCTAAALWLWPAWPGRVSLPVMLAVAAGLLHSQYVLHAAIASRMPASYDGSEIVVEGRIVGPVSRQMLAGGRPWQRFDFQLTTQPVPGQGQVMPAGLQRLRLSAYTPERFHSGEYRRLQLRLRAARNYANPGSFDYQRYLLARRIDALGTVLQVHPAVGEYGTHALERSRSVQRDTIVRALDGLPAQPLLQALLLGERSGLGSKQRDLLVKTGTVHLFAISGLHISLAAGLGYGLALWLPRIMPGGGGARLNLCLPAQQRAAVLCLLPALYYAWLSGMALSTQRALLMLGCFSILVLLRLTSGRYSALLAAAWLILLFDPLAVLDAGFWYSVTAVALLMAILRPAIAGAESLSRPDGALRRAGRYWRELLRVQAYFLLAMPVVQALFGQPYYLLSWLANAVAIPVLSLLVMPLALAGATLAQLSAALAVPLLWLAGTILNQLFAGLEQATVLTRSLNPQLGAGLQGWEGGLGALALLMVLVGRQGPAWRLALAALLILLSIPAQDRSANLAYGDLRVTQLDVGQGTAVLLQTRSYRLLYDAGPGVPDGFNAGSAIIAPFLRQRGIDRLDDVVVSHGDLDHAGGIPGLRNWIRVDRWLAPPGLAALARQSQLPCHRQRRWQRDGIVFEVLSPQLQDRALAGNDHSCVLHVYSLLAPGQGLLLTGDIERKAELALVSRHRGQLSSAIISVPHHGSKTSSTYALLSASDADYALLSGPNNRYGHPAPEVIERYRQVGVEVLASANLGAVELLLHDGQWLGPRCARYRRHRSWLHTYGSRQVRSLCLGAID